MTVRVFTVANESRYVVVRNVPALGVIEDLLKRLSLYGKVCEYRLLDHPDDRQEALQFEGVADDDNEFTDTVWVQYETVNNARHAKVRGVQKPFFGNRLQISYAPQFESREDTADKLAQRRQLLLRRARPGYHSAAPMNSNKRLVPQNPPLPPPLPPAHAKVDFIGPQLPPRRAPASSTGPQEPKPSSAAAATTNPQPNTKRRRI
ncbi:hypothetical protein PRIC1_013009 [Phytophthora ramorum]|nr:RNA-binding protein 48 [Phytophthora ramorum]